MKYVVHGRRLLLSVWEFIGEYKSYDAAKKAALQFGDGNFIETRIYDPWTNNFEFFNNA